MQNVLLLIAFSLFAVLFGSGLWAVASQDYDVKGNDLDW